MHLLGRVNGYDIYEDDDGCVSFTSPTTIDADGANGQNGNPVAYKADDTGTDALKNAGLAIVDRKVICVTDGAHDCVILGSDNEPEVFPGGLIASTTWYRYPGKRPNDPSAYVDAEAVPYIVVPPQIVQATIGIVRGCKARATFQGKSVDCVVADLGSRNHLGELSIAAARALGIPSNPRGNEGEDPIVDYALWPGVAANGFALQAA